MNDIQWQTKAAKQLLKLDRQMQVVIRDEVGIKLSVFPKCSGVKPLTNHKYDYRLRAGNYRVFFNFDDDAACIVSVEEVKKRDERTY